MLEQNSPEVHTTIYLKDYQPPDYRIHTVNLQFDLDEKRTIVKSLLTMNADYDRTQGDQAARPARERPGADVCFAGRQEARTRRIYRGRRITHHPAVPAQFTLEIETEINPDRTTRNFPASTLSGSGFFTQCEAEGFRKITYYPDRPDVMARFFTTIVADKKKYPVLLSNGNLIGTRRAEGRKAFCQVARPVPQAGLSLCPRGRRPGPHRRQVHDHVGPRGDAAYLCSAS